MDFLKKQKTYLSLLNKYKEENTSRCAVIVKESTHTTPSVIIFLPIIYFIVALYSGS